MQNNVLMLQALELAAYLNACDHGDLPCAV